jgi:hypothetical protein
MSSIRICSENDWIVDPVTGTCRNRGNGLVVGIKNEDGTLEGKAYGIPRGLYEELSGEINASRILHNHINTAVNSYLRAFKIA